MCTTKIKVLVVDDHPVVAEGTISWLSSEARILVLGAAHNGKECIHIVSTKIPDIVLLEINLPDIYGINLIEKLLEMQPQLKIIMFTGHNPEEYLISSLVKGAYGFLPKNCSKSELIQGVLSVIEGGFYFPDVMGTLLRSIITRKERERLSFPNFISQFNNLTPRETDILKLIAKGLQNKEIAGILAIKTRTVEFHVSSIFSKLGVNSRLEAVLTCVKKAGEA